MAFEGVIAGVKTVKEIVGKEWIDRELEKIEAYKPPKDKRKLSYLGYSERLFHPLAFLIFQAERHLASCAERKFFEPTEEIVRLAYLGERLSILKNKQIKGLERKIEELKSEKKDLFDKTSYEIQVAAAYAETGHDVSFIETLSKDNLATPDLLVNDIEIECKRKDGKTERDRANIENWNLIGRSVSPMFDYVGLNYSVTIKTINDPRNDDVEFIKAEIQKLAKARKEGKFAYDNGVSITLEILSWKDQVIPVTALPKVILDEYDHVIWAGELDSPDFFKAKHAKNPRIFGFKTGSQPDRIESVIDSIKKAHSQLSGMRPAIVYVHLNSLDRRMADADFKRLDELIHRQLTNNATITAIVITSEFFEKDKDSFHYSHKAKVIKNSTAKNPLPSYFNIIGESSS